MGVGGTGGVRVWLAEGGNCPFWTSSEKYSMNPGGGVRWGGAEGPGTFWGAIRTDDQPGQGWDSEGKTKEDFIHAGDNMRPV